MTSQDPVALRQEDPRIHQSTQTVSQPDVTLLLDDNGVIQTANLFNAISREGVQDWFGRAWADTVGGDFENVRQMLRDARTSGVSAFGQVTQTFPSGLEVPMEYTTVRLGGKAGLLAIGRNVLAVAELQARLIAAQDAMERDYWKLRQIETRYRLLFDASVEAVLLVEAGTLRILEANPAAIRSIGVPAGENLMDQVAPGDRDILRALLSRTFDQSKNPGQVVHLGPDRQAWVVRASLMVSEPSPVYLLQFSDLGGRAQPEPRRPMTTDRLMERLPDALLVLNQSGVVLRANRAFLDLVQAEVEGAVTGQPLGRWLTRPGADASVMLATLHRHRSVRNFRTSLEGELGTEHEVEVSAADDQDTNPQYTVVLMRRAAPDGGRAEPERDAGRAEPLPSLEPGKSLRDLVQNAIGSVEQHYLLEALRKAEGNRTLAADLLGLSRQTLYSKMDRYGLNSASLAEREETG